MCLGPGRELGILPLGPDVPVSMATKWVWIHRDNLYLYVPVCVCTTRSLRCEETDLITTTILDNILILGIAR
jgi:hypothetical protein